MRMAGVAEILSNPIVAFALRAALGAYVIYMARGFYADPFGYFRKWMPRMPEYEWMRRAIRGAACFCVWGGCFIVAAAVAAQILDLHGWALAFALVVLAAIATYFLLPRDTAPMVRNESGKDAARRSE
jgi:hypothetical protein